MTIATPAVPVCARRRAVQRVLPIISAALLLTACDARSPEQTFVSAVPVPVAAASCAAEGIEAADILAVTRTPGDAPLADLSHYQARNAPVDPVAVLNNGACATNTTFRYAAGAGDITGPIGANMSGYVDGEQIATGIRDRQHARAFVVESNCAGRLSKAVIVQMDIGLAFSAIRQGVLNALAADATLSAHYGDDNVMLNASHSHGTAAGQSHFDAFHVLTNGHDAQSYQATIDGIITAITKAHANLGTATAGKIRFNQAELLNGTTNRSLPAYAANPAAERNAFLDVNGNEVNVNRMMSLVKLQRDDGTEVGMLNWYPIHGTSIWQRNLLLTGDNKGFAAFRFEKDFATDPLAAETFLAGFMQGDEGDNSPNLFIPDLTEAELRDLNSPGFKNRAGGRTEFENAVISGYKQYKHAKDLYTGATEILTGEVAAKSIFIDFATGVTVATPRSYPAALQPASNSGYITCKPALGVSFAGGAEDGRGPTAEGQTCANTTNSDVASAAALFESNANAGANGALPPGLIVPAGCDNPVYDNLNYACHEEKPIIFPLGEQTPFLPATTPQTLEPGTMKLQIITIGNLAIIGVPWEVTTMSGRRVRNSILNALQGAGIDYAVISGLTNGYLHYMVTREEYSTQQYEGASTVYGPWAQEAIEQELVRLAGHIRAGTPATSPFADPTFGSVVSNFVNTPTIDDGTPPAPFGTVITEPNPQYQLDADMETIVAVTFVAGDPRRDLKQEASYTFIERQVSGVWQVVDNDNGWFTSYEYLRDQGDDDDNHGVVSWYVPADTPAGTYRIRHEGDAASGAYSGTSQPFTIVACQL